MRTSRRRASLALAVAAALWGLGAELARAEPCVQRGRRCSTPPTPPGAPRTLADAEASLAAAARLLPGERVVVPVIYHLVYDAVSTPPGDEPDDVAHVPPLALLHRQTEVLNHAFRGTRFSFVTTAIELHSFAPWSSAGLAEMIREVRGERRTSMHVFLLRAVENRASSPESRMVLDFEGDTDVILMDWDYLPYVEALRPIRDRVLRRYYFEGEMLVHLAGHYLGLRHTFDPAPRASEDEGGGEGGDGEDNDNCKIQCAQTSDLVRDTPVHRWVWGDRGRCIPIDTCKDFPGMDPITNYMNLEPDLCASEFTPGQIERMERMVRVYRCEMITPPASCRKSATAPGSAGGHSKR